MKKPILILSSLFLSYSSFAECNSICQQRAEESLSKMTMTEKIGQMLLVGFRGQSINDRHEITNDIKNNKIGSVILFEYDAKLRTRARNIQSKNQVKALTTKLQSYSDIPLFIAIDEEGGLVTRLKAKYGFQTFPAPAKIGERDDVSYTKRQSLALSAQLRSVGINMNFAPVVDVNVNPTNPVIGKLGRSFSEDEYKVGIHSEQVIRAHSENDVYTALKHFPGHGSSTKDSHKSLVDVTDTWEERELYPYEYLIGEELVQMIMTAHVFQRHLDPKYPATLSRKIIHGKLRGEMGYNGVVISDDMNMKAITNHYALNEAIRLSIVAGVDILLFGNNLDYDKHIATKAQQIIKGLINNGSISAARIDISARRVLRLKYSTL